MLLIVGLGNPGLKFKKTRHNIGFRVLDILQKESDFPKFKLDKKSRAEISKGIINGQEVLLAKPQTYMNNSGFAVKALKALGSFGTPKEPSAFGDSLVVIHDDFDLPFGEIKLTENSGSGGHHGISSIIEALGTKNFKRVKIGIRPYLANGNPVAVNLKAEDFVLKKFTKTEESCLSEAIKNALQVIMTR